MKRLLLTLLLIPQIAFADRSFYSAYSLVPGATAQGTLIMKNNQWINWLDSGGVESNVLRVTAANVTQLNARSGASVAFAVNGSNRFSVDSSGGFTQDATNGGGITLSKASTSVAEPVNAAVTAAGTTVTDATQLTAVYNWATTVAASTGVKLWDATAGSRVYVQNLGANNLELYPASGAQTINGAAAGGGITLAAATDDIASCFKISSNQWSCTVDTGPAT